MQIQFERRHAFSVNDRVTITGSAADDGSYIVTAVVNDTTIDVGPKVWSTTDPGSSAFASSDGLSFDDASDQDLIDAALADPTKKLLIVDSAGSPVANRFVPPPDWKHSVAKFQDRTFYGADNLDGFDEITVTQDSTTFTYSDIDVNFNIPGNAVGNVIWVPLASGGWSRHTVESIDTTTTVTVYPPAAEDTVTQGHAQRPEENERNVIYYSEPDEPESVPPTNIITIQEQSEDEDEIVGLHAFGAYLYILKQRHIYSFSFARQPKIDGQARLITHRGAFNKRCWAVYEGQAYIMDQSGSYILQLNGDFSPISDPIQNYFRDGTVDFEKSKWFFVSCDYNSAVVRFHVSFTGDSGERPRRALCYSIRHKTWWTESYPIALADSAMVEVNKRPQLICGGQADIVIDMERQEADMVDTEIRGTVSSSTDTTLTDNTASFTDEIIGAPVGILTGDGRCQIRTIISRVNDKTFTIGDPAGSYLQFETQSGLPLFFQNGDPWEMQSTVVSPGGNSERWEVNPSANDKYIIGGIGWVYRTKQFHMQREDKRVKHNFDVNYLPTLGEYTFDVSMFFDEDAYAAANYVSMDRGDGVEVTEGDDFHLVNTDRDRVSRGTRVGESRVTFSNQIDSRNQGKRRVTFQLKGIKADAPMAIDAINLTSGK
jgi:hypothetical protein